MILMMNAEMRPEEIIAEVYRQMRCKREQGENPCAVLMNPDQYQLLNFYRRFRGRPADDRLEYLQQYSIFGLEILMDNNCSTLRVC